MKPVRAKKKLGQHFLNDPRIAQKIAALLQFEVYERVLEIGPGMGILSDFLIKTQKEIFFIEVDADSVAYLQTKYPEQKQNIITADFLKYNLKNLFVDAPFAIIGNFPYNISTQIVFKLLEYRHQVPFFAGMFQKEVAQRICEPPGTKTYGILSVLTQLFYETTYCFTVSPNVFTPPPKVESAVIELKRKQNFTLPCNEKLLFQIVKAGFQQRRKTLRNSLKQFQLPNNYKEDSIFGRRPEHLSGVDFIELTNKIDHGQF